MLEKFRKFNIREEKRNKVKGGNSIYGAPGANTQIRIRGLGSVMTSSANGQPGGAVSVRIRGTGS